MSTLPSSPVDAASRPRRLGRLAVLLLQLALLSAIFAGWLVLGRVWRLPFPAGLLAMLTVVGLLGIGVLPLSFVERGAGFLLRHIALLFVPICIGAVRQLPLLQGHGWAFAALILAGAATGQATAGLLAQALCRKPGQSGTPSGFES